MYVPKAGGRSPRYGCSSWAPRAAQSAGATRRVNHGLARVAPPGGESFSDLAARVWPAFDRIVSLAAGRGAGRILVVAHQAVNRVILAREWGLPLKDALGIPQ
ncbi:MAG: histidine phosphatase family protein, partial [Treponema sp.]|nr:histidine phosphatase family protein [Treponema sp.]